jgi:hypothetical protein
MTRLTITDDGTMGKQHKTIGPRAQTTDILGKGTSCPPAETLTDGAATPCNVRKREQGGAWVLPRGAALRAG